MPQVKPIIDTSGKLIDYKGFPNPLAPESAKNEPSYGIAYAKAIWNAWNLQANIVANKRQRDIINRRYAEGLESVLKYLNRMDIGDTSYLNLDFSPTNRIASIVDNIVGRLMNMDYKVKCNAIDPASLTKFDKFRRETYTNMFLKKYNDVIEQATGIPLIPTNVKIPDDTEEAELHLQLNYKDDLASSMEQVIEMIFYNSGFDDIRKKIIRDLVVLKKAAILRYYDSDKNIKVDWVDPVDIIIPYSKYDDFRNVPYQGLISKYTIQEISQFETDFTEQDLFNIAKTAGSSMGNRRWAWGNSYEGYYQNAARIFGRGYDDFNVSVLRFWFKTTNIDKYEEKTNVKRGNTFEFEKKDEYYTPDNKDKKVKSTIHNKATEYIYEGYWVIGTDYIWGYKKQENIERQKNGISYSPKAELPITMVYPDIYDMENKSLVERMIPHEDQINLIHLKAQQFIMEAAPPGLAIDTSSLDEVVAGMGRGENVMMDPKQIVKLRKQTGSFVYSSVRADGSVINGSPITPLENGIGRMFSQFIVAYNHEIQLMNDVIGYNSAVDASSPDTEALVGTQKLAVQASMNVLRPLANNMIRLIERTANRVSLMVQDKCEYGGGIQGYVPSVGLQAVKTIDAGKELALAQFGIKVEFLPDEEEKQELYTMLTMGMQQGTLKPSDILLIREYMKSNVRLAAQLMILRENKNIKEAQESKQKDSELNAQAQSQAAVVAQQAQQQTLQIEMQSKMQELKMEMEMKMALSAQEHQQKMQQIQLQMQMMNQGKSEVAQINHEGAMNTMAYQNAIMPRPTEEQGVL